MSSFCTSSWDPQGRSAYIHPGSAVGEEALRFKGYANGAVCKRFGGAEPREAITSQCRVILSLVLADSIGIGSVRDFRTFQCKTFRPPLAHWTTWSPSASPVSARLGTFALSNSSLDPSVREVIKIMHSASISSRASISTGTSLL